MSDLRDIIINKIEKINILNLKVTTVLFILSMKNVRNPLYGVVNVEHPSENVIKKFIEAGLDSLAGRGRSLEIVGING